MKDLILNYAVQANIVDKELFLEKVELFFNILEEKNKVMNLTRITSFEEYAIKHVIDSLMIAVEFKELFSQKLKIADIGCGGGFPSIILAMAFPNLQITSIDSTGKKIRFVEEAANKLNLTNIKAIQGRANELNRKKEFQQKFDIVTARAVAPSQIIHFDTNNFPNSNGRYIFYKTPNQAQEELPFLVAQGKKEKINWSVTPLFNLPNNMGERVFLYSYKKVEEKKR